MASKACRIKEIRKITSGQDELGRMFAEMTGAADSDPTIIAPKVLEVRKILRHVCGTLTCMASHSVLREKETLTVGLDNIATYVGLVRAEFGFEEAELDEKHYLALPAEEINEMYRGIKENEIVRGLITLANELSVHKVCLKDKDDLRGTFIAQTPGISYVPFNFSELDLGYAWGDGTLNAAGKQYILRLLHYLYVDTLDLYHVITSPDIDVTAFTAVLVESIDGLSKIPQLSRSKKAFARIRNSVKLLETNFGNYYRISVATSTPSAIIENFIMDVSTEGSVSATLTWEFKQIIQYMRTLSDQNGRSQDPQVQKLFGMLQSNFNLMSDPEE